MSLLCLRRLLIGWCAAKSAAYVVPLHVLGACAAAVAAAWAALFLTSASGLACAMVGAQGA